MELEKKIARAQKFLQKHHIDGWLLYDFQRRNPLAVDVLEIPQDAMLTRPLFYWIPSTGEPTKIVHAVEVEVTAHLPGHQKVFSGRHTLHSLLQKELKGASTIAMEYSPRGATPNISFVDGGTIDLIKGLEKEVVSSGDLLQEVLCVLTNTQSASHTFAASVIRKALDRSWEHIENRGVGVSEWEVQQEILSTFQEHSCIYHGAPIVAFGKNAANPHYETSKDRSASLEEGDVILIDLWCKQEAAESIYADVTEMGIFKKEPSPREIEIFSAVRAAQEEAFSLLETRYQHGEVVKGFELDEVARRTIEEAGFGHYFTHRLGHNIFTTDHGPGANLDSFETLDERQLIRGTCFSIEPGIYIPGEIGVRLEYDVYIPESGPPEITTGKQSDFRRLP